MIAASASCWKSMRNAICLAFFALGVFAQETQLQRVTLATNLVEPIQLSIARDGRVFFGERHGAVKVWDPKSGSSEAIGQLEVFTGPEDGLLGLALDPGFLTNHWLYLFHSTPGVFENQVSRFAVENGKLDLESRKTLL